ncbi:MAG: hypothetical protein JSW11_09785 [Candidatus Heimdallarchaeota archaeon]|nr:MAG: hypothetical protein JSW11_09785 [Candidatus Heimdallarchaeota archaeon]
MTKNEVDSGTEKDSIHFLDSIEFPPPIENIELSPTEQRVYLQLSLKFQKMLDDAPSFQMGAYRWNQALPMILQRYAITADVWERISEIGDQDDDIQAQLNQMIEEME